MRGTVILPRTPRTRPRPHRRSERQSRPGHRDPSIPHVEGVSLHGADEPGPARLLLEGNWAALRDVRSAGSVRRDDRPEGAGLDRDRYQVNLRGVSVREATWPHARRRAEVSPVVWTRSPVILLV